MCLDGWKVCIYLAVKRDFCEIILVFDRIFYMLQKSFFLIAS